MRPFAYFEPTTLDEATALLSQYNGQANLLAGGTDLLVEIKEQMRRPDYVINIKKIPGMGHLHFDETAGLRFGALVTARTLETNPLIITHYAGLAQAVRELGSIQIRNRATIAGNICRASPSADTLPPLIADGAWVKIFGPDGERSVALEEFFRGPGQTILGANEIVTEISVPSPPPHTGKVYLKHGRRRAMELATVGVAVSITLDGETCRDVRIVLGAVAPTPIRAKTAETTLRDQTIDEGLIAAAAEQAMQASAPISDVRASADYRREMVRVLTNRVIEEAINRARLSESQ